MSGLGIFVALFFSIVIQAQQAGVLRGRVTIASDGSPLPGATVSIDELNLSSVTDADGRYQINVPAARAGQSVKVSAALQGFQTRTATATLGAGEVTVDFAMRVSFGQEITVGSRAVNAEAEKAVPVDIITHEQIESAPSTETNQIIAKMAPSFNFPRPTLSDGTDSVRPATLRGLGPDQVLVMVNGKRRHVAALVNVNGTVGRGSAGVDLNAIPASAIDSVEILRDGAAAQYGSDAIAGVLNLVLKSDAQPLKLEVKGGSTTHGDGQMVDSNLSGGWNVGRGAVFATVEYRDRYDTNRALNDPRDQIVKGDAGNNAVSQPNTHWGDAYERDIMSLANLNLPISQDGKQVFYAFGTYDLRHGSAGGNYRRALDATDWPQIYPLGFLPLIEPRIADQALTAGARGQAGSWFYDASAGYGRNKMDFYVRNSLNVSLGPTGNQTSFYAGSLGDRQTTANVDFSRGFNLGLAGPINVAAGVEYRREGYQVIAGEPNSYIDGGKLNQAGGKAAPGSQVFPGFRPSNAVDASRNSKAIYVDTEGDVLAQLRVGIAARHENFSDFGGTTNEKLTLRYTPIKQLIFRGAASTGFRAPSLGQSWFSAASTNFIRSTIRQRRAIRRPDRAGEQSDCGGARSEAVAPGDVAQLQRRRGLAGAVQPGNDGRLLPHRHQASHRPFRQLHAGAGATDSSAVRRFRCPLLYECHRYAHKWIRPRRQSSESLPERTARSFRGVQQQQDADRQHRADAGAVDRSGRGVVRPRRDSPNRMRPAARQYPSHGELHAGGGELHRAGEPLRPVLQRDHQSDRRPDVFGQMADRSRALLPLEQLHVRRRRRESLRYLPRQKPARRHSFGLGAGRQRGRISLPD